MNLAAKLLGEHAAQQKICRAEVIVDDDKSLAVRFANGVQSAALVLQTGFPLTLNNGDTVLVCLPSEEQELPVVLGRVAQYNDNNCQDELVIEANKSLQLKCGQGNVTIRKNKVLVKGKEVVSSAKGANQVKGGSVSIN